MTKWKRRLVLYKTPIADSVYRYLQQVLPHHALQYILLAIALLIASIPWWYKVEMWTPSVLLVMAIPILSVYWFFQFSIVQSAVCLAKYDSTFVTPDLLLKTVPQDIATFAQVRAVLRHYRHFIVGVSFALLSLSLAITVYLYYWPFYRNGRGILKYVGVVGSGYFLPSIDVPTFPYLRWPVTILLATILLLALTISNSLLSASIGLWAGQKRLAFMSRLRLTAIIFAIFLSLYALRETPFLQCNRNFMQGTLCDNVLFQMRLVDSFQAMSLTLADGSVALVTGVHLPNGVGPVWEGYQWRYLLVGITSILFQVALSVVYLWRSNAHNRKNRVIWLLGISGGVYCLWRYR